MSNKQAVIETIQGLPEGATFEEIIEEIAILAAIRRGEEAADRGDVISNEDMKKRSWDSR